MPLKYCCLVPPLKGFARLLCRYQRNREPILMVGVFIMMVLPGKLLVPFWLEEADAQRLQSLAFILKISAAPGIAFMLLVLR